MVGKGRCLTFKRNEKNAFSTIIFSFAVMSIISLQWILYGYTLVWRKEIWTKLWSRCGKQSPSSWNWAVQWRPTSKTGRQRLEKKIDNL